MLPICNRITETLVFPLLANGHAAGRTTSPKCVSISASSWSVLSVCSGTGKVSHLSGIDYRNRDLRSRRGTGDLWLLKT